jgi:hypothetical protein
MEFNKSQAGAAIQIVKHGASDLMKSKGKILRLKKTYQFVIKNQAIQDQWHSFINGSDYCLANQESYKSMFNLRKQFLKQFAV